MNTARRILLKLQSLERRLVPTTFPVTNTADNGSGSFRQAVENANSNPGADTIVFDATVFATQKTIALTSGTMAVSGKTTITGPPAGVVLDAGGLATAHGIFTFAAAATDSLTMSRLIMTGANAANSGGVIRVTSPSDLIMIDCVITGNIANLGGGIAMVGNNATLTLENCSLIGNSANYGGGIYANSINTQITLRNCTFSGNNVDFVGGAIAFYDGGVMLVANSTLTKNAAIGDLNSSLGGAIYVDSTSPIVTLKSSIVAGNLAKDGSQIYQEDSFVSLQNSAVGTSIGFDPFDAGGNLPYGIDLKLGALAENGGLGKTHMPALDSPVIDKGANPTGLTTDQRGGDHPRTVGVAPDIGAVEVPDFVVRNINDSGPGSLRQILAETDVIAGQNTVTFDPAVFSSPQTITLTSNSLFISSAVAIVGPGAALTSINGKSGSPVFITNFAPAETAIDASGLTVAGGFNGFSVEDEHLTLTDCVVTGNTSAGVQVVSEYGSLTLDRCAITNNKGGGVRLFGYLSSPSATIRDTTISGNSAVNGGGLFVMYAANVSVLRSTISGNQAGAAGGGIYSSGHNATRSFSIVNSTISGNSAASGGGIAWASQSAAVSIHNSTITANTAGTSGGGLARLSGSGAIDVTSSIVAANTAPANANIASTGTVNLTSSITGDGTNLKLGPLADNGGPTFTHALLSGSAAINAGANPQGLSTDQRGIGFDRVVGGLADVGAFEFVNPIVPAKVTQVQVNDGSVQRSRVSSLSVTFDQLPTLPVNPADAFQLKRQGDDFVVSLSAAPSGNTVTLTFVGGPVESASLADGRYTLTILASQIMNLDGDGNGVVGDDHVVIGHPVNAPKLYRLFGDGNGDGKVDSSDFILFRSTFNLALGQSSYNSAFDSNGDGKIDSSDFVAFRQRFNTSV